jgi:hypothetical protein
MQVSSRLVDVCFVFAGQKPLSARRMARWGDGGEAFHRPTAAFWKLYTVRLLAGDCSSCRVGRIDAIQVRHESGESFELQAGLQSWMK